MDQSFELHSPTGIEKIKVLKYQNDIILVVTPWGTYRAARAPIIDNFVWTRPQIILSNETDGTFRYEEGETTAWFPKSSLQKTPNNLMWTIPYSMLDECLRRIESGHPLDAFGKLTHKGGWDL